jgi:hypothetical protein
MVADTVWSNAPTIWVQKQGPPPDGMWCPCGPWWAAIASRPASDWRSTSPPGPAATQQAAARTTTNRNDASREPIRAMVYDSTLRWRNPVAVV